MFFPYAAVALDVIARTTQQLQVLDMVGAASRSALRIRRSSLLAFRKDFACSPGVVRRQFVEISTLWDLRVSCPPKLDPDLGVTLS